MSDLGIISNASAVPTLSQNVPSIIHNGTTGHFIGATGSPLQPQSLFGSVMERNIFQSRVSGSTSYALGEKRSKVIKNREETVSNMRTPGYWHRDTADITINALADVLKIQILFKEPFGYCSVGNVNASCKVIIKRSSKANYEHYSLVQGNDRSFSSFDGNSFFRVVSQALHGDDKCAEQYRNLAADHVYENWQDYANSAGHSSWGLKPLDELPEKLATLDSAYPQIKEKILSNMQEILVTELHAMRKPEAEKSLTTEQKKRINEIIKHFMVFESKERIESLIKLINKSEKNAQKAIVNNYRLNEIHTQLDESQNLLKLKINDSMRFENIIGYESLLLSLFNQDITHLAIRKGMTFLQLSNALQDEQLALMMDFYALIGVKSLDLTNAINELQLEAQDVNSMEVIAPALISKIKNVYTFFFESIRPYLPDELMDHNMRSNTQVQEMDDYHSDNYDYQTPLAELINRGNAIENEVIANRLLRLLEIRFLMRQPLLNLMESTANNSPLLQERSIVGEDEQRLFLEGHYAYTNIINVLNDNRLERLRILLGGMPIAPLILGDDYPITEMNIEGLPYGARGLSLSLIERWLSDEAISDARLSCIGFYCCTAMSEITCTGDVDISWMKNLHDDTLIKLFQTAPNPRLHNQPNVFTLIETLIYMGRALDSSSQDQQLLTTLFKHSQHEIQRLGNQTLDDNQLVYLLVEEYKNDILAMASQIYDENVQDYQPAQDWAKLIAKIATDSQLILKIECCPNEASNIVQRLPEEALLRTLAQIKKIAIGKGFIRNNFNNYFNPAGEQKYTRATLPTTYINIMPDTLYLMHSPQLEKQIKGGLAMVSRNPAQNNLQLLQDFIKLDFANDAGRQQTLTDRQEEIQAYLALVRQVADRSRLSGTAPSQYEAEKNQSRFKRKRDEDHDSEGGASSIGIAGSSGLQTLAAATRITPAVVPSEQSKQGTQHDVLGIAPEVPLQMRHSLLPAENAGLEFHHNALSLISAYEMLLKCAKTAETSPEKAAEYLKQSASTGIGLATIRGYVQPVDQLFSYYFEIIHQLFDAQALTSQDVYALTLDHSAWDVSPATRALTLINNEKYQTSSKFIYLLLAAGQSEGSHRELKNFLNTRKNDFSHSLVMMQSSRDGLNRIKHEALADWLRKSGPLSPQAQQIVTLLGNHQLLDNDRKIASLYKKSRITTTNPSVNTLVQANPQQAIFTRIMAGQHELESTLSAEYLRLGSQEKYSSVQQDSKITHKDRSAPLLRFISLLSDVLTDFRQMTAHASSATRKKDLLFEEQEIVRQLEMNSSSEQPSPINIIPLLLTEILSHVTQSATGVTSAPIGPKSGFSNQQQDIQPSGENRDSLSEQLSQLNFMSEQLNTTKDDDVTLQSLTARLARLRSNEMAWDKSEAIEKAIEQALNRNTSNSAALELTRLNYRTEVVNQEIKDIKNRGLKRQMQSQHSFSQ